MKHILATVCLILTAVGAFAQSTYRDPRYSNRAPTLTEEKRLAGVAEHVQDVFRRNNQVVVLNTNLQPVFTITNHWEGTYYVKPTNAELSAAFTIALPNPTNHVNRRFTFFTPDGCHIVLSNNWGTGGGNGFRDMKTDGVSNVVWLVTSNKVTHCYSTGTNYLVKVQ